MTQQRQDDREELSDSRIEQLHDWGREDAEMTGGSLLAAFQARPGLTAKELEIYEYAFRNTFHNMSGR